MFILGWRQIKEGMRRRLGHETGSILQSLIFCRKGGGCWQDRKIDDCAAGIDQEQTLSSAFRNDAEGKGPSADDGLVSIFLETLTWLILRRPIFRNLC